MESKWDLVAIAAIMSTVIVASLMLLWWIACFVSRSLRSLYVSRYQLAPAFPVRIIDEGEGTYRIEGVMRGNEEEVVWMIDARTRANAIAKAELRGAVVTQVMKLAPVATNAAVEPVESADHHPVTTV